MDEDNGLSLVAIVVLALLAAAGLWVVWSFVGFLVTAVKGLLTLALVGALLYGGYRVLGGSGKS